MRTRIYQIVHIAKRGDHVSRAYDMFVVLVAFISIIPTLFHANTLPENIRNVISFLDLISVYVLMFDYILRWITHDLKEGRPNDWRALARYPFTPMAIIDLLAILPSLNVLPASFLFLRALRIVRIFRYSRHLSIISNVIYQQRRTLGYILLLAILYIFVTSLIMFTLEADTFTDFVDALYWGTITLTTIGFGDIHPLTDLGRVITSISSLFGIFVLALPAGLMTSSFLQQLQLKQDEGDAYYAKGYFGGIDLSYFKPSPARLRGFFADNPKVRIYLRAILVGIGIDLLLCAIASEGFWQPVWLDTTGTAIVACLLDPAAGIIVGFVNNLVLAFYTGNAGNILYIAQSAVVAIAYGLLMPVDANGDFPRGNMGKLLAIVILVQTVISFALSMILAQGSLITIFMQAYQQAFMDWGLPFPVATFGALLIDRVLDSLCVIALVRIAVGIMGSPGLNPKHWLIEQGVEPEEDFSQFVKEPEEAKDDAQNADKALNISELMELAGTGSITMADDAASEIERRAEALEARAAACDADGKHEDAERYRAGASALRILQNGVVRDADEYGRLFDALVFNEVKRS